MFTFLIGLAILLVGGFIYAQTLQKVFKTNKNIKTIALTKRDNVDYVPMNKYKNAFIQLKSVAATGPILGPIQGIIFGPIVFLTIPIGNIFGGLVHDTYSGLISMRNGGAQVPKLVQKIFGKIIYLILFILIVVLSLLVSAVFVTMPAKLVIGQIQHASTDVHSLITNWVLWIVVLLIFAYYIIATIFPIHTIIGKVYPTLSIILMTGTLILFVGACTHTPNLMPEIWNVKYGKGDNLIGLINPSSGHFVPLIFVTITCGMVSGFHSTQSTIVGRAVKNETDSKITFSYPMIIEGVITMVWAFIALEMFANHGHDAISNSRDNVNTNYDLWIQDPTQLIGSAAHTLLWNQSWLSIFVILVVCMEAVTVGDTSLRSCRLICAEHFNTNQKPMSKRLIIATPIFILTAGLMFVGLFEPNGFNYLWKYFAWTDQTTVAFTFAVITIYLLVKDEFYYLSLIPGGFYTFISLSFIIGSDTQGINALLPQNLQNNCWIAAYTVGALAGIVYMVVLIWYGSKIKKQKIKKIEDEQVLLHNTI